MAPTIAGKQNQFITSSSSDLKSTSEEDVVIQMKNNNNNYNQMNTSKLNALKLNKGKLVNDEVASISTALSSDDGGLSRDKSSATNRRSSTGLSSALEEKMQKTKSLEQGGGRANQPFSGLGAKTNSIANSSISEEDARKEMLFNRCVSSFKDLFELIGEDPNREGILESPKRAVKALLEMCEGYKIDPQEKIKCFGLDGADTEIVLEKNIEFTSLCEHHLLPFMGHIHIAYIPKDKVVGLSKFGRVVDAISHRLQVQERLTSEVADAFYCSEDLAPKGVAVTCTAKHSCMCLRGIRKQDPETTTSAYRGVFKEDLETKKEYMRMLKL